MALQSLCMAVCSEMSAYQKQAMTKGQQAAVCCGTVVPSSGHSLTQTYARA